MPRNVTMAVTSRLRRRDLDSTLVLTFWPVKGDGRIDLTHVNVAESDFPGVSEGWSKYYWVPWRDYLTRSKRASVPIA